MTPVPEPAGEPVTADAGRVFARPESLAGVVRAAFGPGPRLAAVDRLRGGSKKGVYRLTFDDAATVIGCCRTTGGCVPAISMTGGCGSTASPSACRSSPGRYGSSMVAIHREPMLEIVEANIARALALL